MSLPTLEQVQRARTALRLAHEDFLVATHCASMVHVENGILQLKAAVAILGYEMVQRTAPPAQRTVGIFPVAEAEIVPFENSRSGRLA